MAFNSLEYLVFFVAILLTSWLAVRTPNLRLLILLLGSYYFYAANNGWILLLLIGTTLVDYWAGLAIAGTAYPQRRSLFLSLSLASNLGMLGYFKYTNFLVANGCGLLGWQCGAFEVFLPIGISFYTFQSISYVVDVYRKRLPAEPSLLRFAFYVAFFPHLVAGPIVRARYFLHQLDEPIRLTHRELDSALFLIALGLFKKMVLADSLATLVVPPFEHPETATAVTAWLGLFSFTMQIFYDFSGYTDVAIGCAKLMGYRIPPNFRRPYTAVSFTEFWRRWHLSLSFWLRDYLYIPLGGSRMRSALGVCRNLMVTMVLGGLWHGASWTFVLWGAIHGVLLSLERLLGWGRLSRDYRGRPFIRLLLGAALFPLVALTWLPFRASSWESLSSYVHALFRVSAPMVITTGMALAVVVILAGWAIQMADEMCMLRRDLMRQPMLLKGMAYGAVAVAIVVAAARDTPPFIYFAF